MPEDKHWIHNEKERKRKKGLVLLGVGKKTRNKKIEMNEKMEGMSCVSEKQVFGE